MQMSNRALRVVACLATLGSAACNSGGTFVHLMISGSGDAIASLDVAATLGGMTATTTLREKAGAHLILPTDAVLELRHGSGALAVTVIARGDSGEELARASGTVEVKAGATVALNLQLGPPAPDMAEPDQATPPDLLVPADFAGTPGVPGNVVAIINGALQAHVSWNPAAMGGTPTTGYRVTSNPGGIIINVDGSTTATDVTGLTAGTIYTFSVEAIDDAGAGPAGVSNTVTAANVPGMATGLVATAVAPNKASVAFNAAVASGSAITQYTVTSNPGSISGTGTTSPVEVSGLANGTSYTFTVVATNVIGDGAPSAASNAIVAADVPGIPTNPAATAVVGKKASVSFTAPAANGSPISSYTVTSSPGALTGSGSTSPVQVTGLAAGTSYTFTVKATNGVGTGSPCGASNAIVAGDVPGVPSSVSASAVAGFKASVSFTAPAANGSSISGYTVTSNPGSLTGSGSSSPIQVTGLTNGQSYTFTVVATNGFGDSSPGGPSNSIVAGDVPAKPTRLSTCAGNGVVRVFWDPVAGASSYNVYKSTSQRPIVIGGGQETKISGVAIGDAIPVVNGTDTNFTVTAVNAIGESVQADLDPNGYDHDTGVSYAAASDMMFLGMSNGSDYFAVEAFDAWTTLAASGTTATRTITTAGINPMWRGLVVDEQAATIYLSNYNVTDDVVMWDHLAGSADGTVSTTRSIQLPANHWAYGLALHRSRNTLFLVDYDTGGAANNQFALNVFYPACRVVGAVAPAGKVIGDNSGLNTANAPSMTVDEVTNELYVFNGSAGTSGTVVVFSGAADIIGTQNLAPSRTITVATVGLGQGDVAIDHGRGQLYIANFANVYRLPLSASGSTSATDSFFVGINVADMDLVGNILHASASNVAEERSFASADTLTGSPSTTRAVSPSTLTPMSIAYVP